VKHRVLIAGTVLALAVGLGFGLRYYLSGPADEPPPAHPDYPLAAPPLRLRPVTWHFGTAPPGRELRHRFEIANRSDQPWTLQSITSTCACTVGKLPSNTVGPGETAWLEVAYRAPPKDGKVSGHVMVDFAAPGPVFQLTIEGEVRGLLSADPPSLVFDYPAPAMRPSQTVRLENRGDRRVTITRVEAPDWLQAEVRPAEGAGSAGRPRQAWRLVIQADPGKLGSAPGSATVTVHTDSDQIGPAYIPVSLKAPLEATPARLDFGTVESGQVGRKRVLLRAAPGLGELAEKDLVVAHNVGDELDVQVHKKDPHLFELSVSFQPKRPRAEVEGELEIKVRKRAVPSVKVKIVGKAAPPPERPTP
jgi:hypothetical protein